MLRYAILAAAIISSPGLAQSGNTSSGPEPEKKVCRSEQETGSYFIKRVCHTPTEWRQIEEQDERNTDMMRNARHSGTGHR